MAKVRTCATRNPLLSWLSSFLSDRFQVVNITDCFSQLCAIATEVVQGGVLVLFYSSYILTSLELFIIASRSYLSMTSKLFTLLKLAWLISTLHLSLKNLSLLIMHAHLCATHCWGFRDLILLPLSHQVAAIKRNRQAIPRALRAQDCRLITWSPTLGPTWNIVRLSSRKCGKFIESQCKMYVGGPLETSLVLHLS